MEQPELEELEGIAVEEPKYTPGEWKAGQERTACKKPATKTTGSTSATATARFETARRQSIVADPTTGYDRALLSTKGGSGSSAAAAAASTAPISDTAAETLMWFGGTLGP